jgi:uncharacterized membrane protein
MVKGLGMGLWGWKRSVDPARVLGAIQEAERQTSGQIRVSVAPFFWGDVEKVARRAFDRLGMAGTRERNGVLIFLVPSRRRFAVLGDSGIHGKVDQAFWEGVARCLEAQFRQGAFTEGLEDGIRQLGQGLAQHFPPTGENELPDDVDFT